MGHQCEPSIFQKLISPVQEVSQLYNYPYLKDQMLLFLYLTLLSFFIEQLYLLGNLPNKLGQQG